MERFEAALSERLVRFVRAVHDRAKLVLGVIFSLTLAFGLYAGLNLGINSDNVSLIAEHLEARRNYLEFAKSFPNIENVMLVVIDGETPELARESTEALQEALLERPDLFHEVYIPGAGAFFEKNGLLYRDLDDLDEFSIQIARVQPILTALEREPTVSNLASLIQSGLEEVEASEANTELSAMLDEVSNATVQVYREFPIEISWEEILLRGSSVDAVTRWVLVIDPALDFASIFSASEPIAEIRRAAESLDLDADHGVSIRITGNPALNFEEMIGILWDISLGGVLTFFVVIGVLLRALRALRIVIAAVITLLVGLVWTGAFAAATVGSLNLISVAFAILFIGLGVDFTIHLGMAYIDALRRTAISPDAHGLAIEAAIRQVGSSLAICTTTTAAGFYVFVPTDNIGVAELGVIAGTGMILNLLLTTTLFPALLATFCRLDPERDLPRAMSFHKIWWRPITERPRIVTGVALVLFALGLAEATQVQFDANVIRMRDQETESVKTFNDLLEEAGPRSPWPLDTIAPDLESADRIAREIEALDVVDFATTLSDYVPTDQDEKIMLLEDVGMILDAPRSASAHSASPSTEEQITALRDLRDFLADPSVDDDASILGASMQSLRKHLDVFLTRLDEGDDPAIALARLERVLLSGLTEQVARLREATLVDPIGLEDLPAELRSRMMTADGHARVQIFPAEQLTNDAAVTRFAEEVKARVPGATGLPMNLLAFAEATRDSFYEAIVYAAVLISVFLFYLWRRVLPVVLVLTPLALSSVLTIGTMAILGIAFNFVNVVVIPLLLGIGVDSGIHLVHRAETLERSGIADHLLSTTTARAVFYSALTTTVSFGTLGLSSHQGMSSLGIVLSIGMVLTVVSNLVVLPALLLLLRGGDSGSRTS